MLSCFQLWKVANVNISSINVIDCSALNHVLSHKSDVDLEYFGEFILKHNSDIQRWVVKYIFQVYVQLFIFYSLHFQAGWLI